MMTMMTMMTTMDSQNTGAVQPDLHHSAPLVPELQSEEMVMFIESEKVLVYGLDLHLQTPACLACIPTTWILQVPALLRNLMLESSQVFWVLFQAHDPTGVNQ